MVETVVSIAWGSWTVLGEMSPYLLFGFLMAGILSVCISPEFIERHLGGRGFGPVWKGSLLGVPMPLCSCGVIPVAAAFRRHGASRAATTSFLLSTPQTGADNIFVIYGLLGLAFAIYSPIVALTTGLLGGLLVMLFDRSNHAGNSVEEKPIECHESCCSEQSLKTNVVRRALEYGLVTLPRDIGVPLLVGAVIAGAIGALASPNELKPYLGRGVLSILLMIAVGIPIYVCSSASVPIAAGLIHLGASPGAALAFLIAGPASNAAAIATMWKLLGPRTVFLYLLTIAIAAVSAGLTLDWLQLTLQFNIPDLAQSCHDASGGWSHSFWAVLLLAVLAFSFGTEFFRRRKGTEEVVDEESEQGESVFGRSPLSPSVHAPSSRDDERIELAIDGMTCGHCSATVARALKECQGVKSVQIDLAAGRAVVHAHGAIIQELAAAVQSAGYRVGSIVDESSNR